MNLIPTPLFRNISREELTEIQALQCMRQRSYTKGEVIFHSGDLIHEMGIALSGNIHIATVDLWGGKTILQNISAGQSFAETYALCHEPLMVDVTCADDAEVLLIDTNTLLREENQKTIWYVKLYRNLLLISLQKNLALSNRIFCTTSKTVRGRLLSYFSFQSVRAGSAQFTIPFDRQQMADYLNLDRSALSKELGKMRKEGLIEFHKNHFILKQTFPAATQDISASSSYSKSTQN
ncbi:Crp/Fnr family transcriptional regulator [Clostridiaceae bacterium]|nr:Crp/Fnr family transcriptional regulator [Clostridiaceae bacterium]NBI84008.1 Crp/Fnr family transcriptional regulator [Clostridiaceae bacterium]